jgi:hypothetical protein
MGGEKGGSYACMWAGARLVHLDGAGGRSAKGAAIRRAAAAGVWIVWSVRSKVWFALRRQGAMHGVGGSEACLRLFVGWGR